MKDMRLKSLKKGRNSRSRIKVLSAVTSVPREELVKAVDTTVSGQLEDRQLSYKKAEKNSHGYGQVTINPFK
ncbi:hypothetical protein [Methanosarcina horonobensis]|uniref:hypothetical protein n=1 Tax=Methanosarcina horonobensis TaxID=418008 RepID=UPI000A91E4FC|nr:hypothetical protein [Methanosarcina horonobensis]